MSGKKEVFWTQLTSLKTMFTGKRTKIQLSIHRENIKTD